MSTDQHITARIGTDIKFKVQLLGETSSNTVNIQSVDAYFINATLNQQLQNDANKFKFIRRYPIEPLVNDYKSTEYCLNASGVYGYVYDGFGRKPFDKKPLLDPCKVNGKVYYTENRDTVEIYFPADRQKQTGDYDLVIDAVIYDPSDSFKHSRKISIDYQSLVTLTGSAEDLPDGISDVVISNSTTSSSIQGW